MKRVSHSTEPSQGITMFVEPDLDFDIEGTISVGDLEDSPLEAYQEE